MKQRKIRNRLLELMQERERKIGRRLKQHDIAQFAGVTDHTIIKWIRNETSRYEAETLERLCDYFDCDMSDFLYFEVTDIEDGDNVD